jgi:hypothetical protein
MRSRKQAIFRLRLLRSLAVILGRSAGSFAGIGPSRVIALSRLTIWPWHGVARKPRPVSVTIWQRVEELIRDEWSPEQVVGRV